jgi:GT2 family glycosyltransferase
LSDNLPKKFSLEVCVVDDNSTDDTVILLKENFSNVNIICTNGNNYWAGAMRHGFMKSWSNDYNGVLVFNDDIVLYDHALEELIASANAKGAFIKGAESTVVVGSTCESSNPLSITYGGYIRKHNLFKPSLTRLVPNEKIQLCDTLNMNFALINSRCIEEIGFLSCDFQHSLADFDYGMAVTNNSGSVWICPSVLGSCDRNTSENSWRDINLDLVSRYRLLKSPKGMPIRERIAFIRRHFMVSNYISLLIPYIILLKDEFIRYRRK